MQIILQALFAEALGKKPETTTPSDDGTKFLFADLFFGETNSDEETGFGEGARQEAWIKNPKDNANQTAQQAPPKMEVILPERINQTKLGVKSMIDITPNDVDGSSANDPEVESAEGTPGELAVVPVAAPLPGQKIEAKPQETVALSKPIGPLVLPEAEQGQGRSNTLTEGEGKTLQKSEPEQVQLPKNGNLATKEAGKVDTFRPEIPSTGVSIDLADPDASIEERLNVKLDPRSLPDRATLKQEILGALPESAVDLQGTKAGDFERGRPAPVSPTPELVRAELPMDGRSNRQLRDRDMTSVEEVNRPASQSAPSSSTAPQLSVSQQPNASAPTLLDTKAARDHVINLDLGTSLGPQDIDDSRPQTPANARAEAAIARPVVNQVVQMVMRANLEGMIEVRLQPEELGRVRLTMTQVDASIIVQITAERPETLDLLRRNIDMLEGDLRDQGFENASFTFGEDGRTAADLADSDQIPGGTDADEQSFQVDIITDKRPLNSDGRLDIRL